MDQYQQYDWDRIPVWNKDNLKDSFILMNDQINGRIPVTKLEHWNQFTSFLDKLTQETRDKVCFSNAIKIYSKSKNKVEKNKKITYPNLFNN